MQNTLFLKTEKELKSSIDVCLRAMEGLNFPNVSYALDSLNRWLKEQGSELEISEILSVEKGSLVAIYFSERSK